MRKFALAALAAGLCCAGAAHAEDYVFDMNFAEPTWVHGIGPDRSWGRAGFVSYTGTVTTAEGAMEISGNCIMMNQPPNGLFDSHMTCDGSDAGGGSANFIYGCNPLNDEETDISCVGAILGTGGAIEGWRGAETLRIIVGTVGATGHGTGQWFD